MKSKISALLVMVVVLFSNSNLMASTVQQNELPNWIDVDYTDAYTNTVSEYQVATVTVSNKSLWWTNDSYEVSVDYDPDQLELANEVFKTSTGTGTALEEGIVTTEDSNFDIKYQFYLKPNVDVSSVPITITKVKNGSETESATVNLAAQSQTTKQNIKFGDIVLTYVVDTYTNDGTNIEYNAHFEVLDNPNKEDFTLSLKENNMTVSSTDIYDVKLRFSDGNATAIDKNNFKLQMAKGDSFDLNITTTIEGLSSKDDKFDFFIYLQDEEGNFARIAPEYFVNTVVETGTDSRTRRYLYINLGLMLAFVLLTILYIGVNINRGKPASSKKKSKKEKETKVEETKVEETRS